MKQDLIINRLYSVVCLLSSVLAPLHLSRNLYKSTLFMQNKPNFRKSQMNLNSLLTTDYERKRDWTLGENKPNSNPNKANLRKAKMNVNLTLTKDYRKNDDFAVRKNKPNTNPIQTQFPSRNAGRINRRVFYFDSLCGFGYNMGCFVT